MPGTNDTIPQLDSAQIMTYIKKKGEPYHLMYCYGGGCPMCDNLLPEFLSFVQKEKIAYSILIIERAADSILITTAINKICQISVTYPSIVILSDSMYDIKYRYDKPQTQLINPLISFGNNGTGDCNKYARYLEKCVPNYISYWHPRILLYHIDDGVIYDAKNDNGTALSVKEKISILTYINNNK